MPESPKPAHPSPAAPGGAAAEKGTPLFDSRLPQERALAVLRHLADGCGARQTGRLVGVDKDTVARYGLRAGGHADKLHDELVAFSPADDQGAAG